jgi:hypothetical protein
MIVTSREWSTAQLYEVSILNERSSFGLHLSLLKVDFDVST